VFYMWFVYVIVGQRMCFLWVHLETITSPVVNLKSVVEQEWSEFSVVKEEELDSRLIVI
jgi:hypothetical protein